MGHARHEVRKRRSVTIKRTVLLEHLGGRLGRGDDYDGLPEDLDMNEVGVYGLWSAYYERRR